MKTRILTFTALIIATMYLNGQSCLPEGITFETQAQIDSFQINYPGCSEIEGSVAIVGTDITNADSLNILTYIKGNLGIGGFFTGCNPNLIKFTGLDNLDTIKGHLNIYCNDSMKSMLGLKSLKYVGDDLAIGHHDNSNVLLSDISGLSNLNHIGGSLIITRNPLLSDLNSLNNLAFIGEDLYIGYPFGSYPFGNSSLVSITGLANLEYVGEKINITDNDLLEDLNGLENIESNSIEILNINRNPLLSNCEVESICAYLQIPGSSAYIFDNDMGCNSMQEVLDSCEANAVKIDEQFAKDYLTLYPNPSTGALRIRYSISDIRYSIFELYTMQGMKIMTLLDKIQQAGEHEMTFDISHLPAGMYFVRLQIGRQVETVKLIKVGSRQ